MKTLVAVSATVMLALILVVVPRAQTPAPGEASCAKLGTVKLAGGTVTSAKFVAAGALPAPPARGGGPAAGGRGNPFADVPAVSEARAPVPARAGSARPRWPSGQPS
jgi:hypothetical protein